MSALRKATAAAAALLLAATAAAEIVTLTGSARVSLREFRDGTAGQVDEASDEFPATSGTLPVQVAASLTAPDEDAAAIGGAQLADPATAITANPQDFALQLALNSRVGGLYYRGTAEADEFRTIRITPAEARGVAAGAALPLTGRFYLDGGLLVLAEAGVTDLSALELSVRVIITQEDDPNAASPVVLFDGTLRVGGAAESQIVTSAEGDFPQAGVLLSDLTPLLELESLQLVLFPDLILVYPYVVAVDAETTLHARIVVEAANAPGVGAAAFIGVPTTGLAQVIETTNNLDLADKITQLVAKERAHPSGVAAFPEAVRPEPVGLCGLFGFEMMAGVVGMLGGRAWSGRRRGRIAPLS